MAERRDVFWAAVLFGAAIVWLAPRPPMSDLPQHVAQVQLWKDLLLGQSPWAELFRINLLTPYLTGYAVALALSFVLPILAAFKLILSLAYVVFVASAVQLRAAMGGDRRLDWLFLPGWFGFAFDWGFYGFLVAAPIALQFMRFAFLHATAKGGRAPAFWLVGLGGLLLVSHGLMFLFAGLVGGAWLLACARGLHALVRAMWPYAVLGGLCLISFVVTRQVEAPAELTGMQYGLMPWMRPLALAAYVQSAGNLTMLPATVLLVAVPLLCGFRLDGPRAVPLGVVLLIGLLVPTRALSTDFLWERFALFALPALALALRPVAPSQLRASSSLLAAAVLISLSWHAYRTLAFAVENRDFETVLAAAAPGKRAAAGALIQDQGSAAARNPFLAVYQPHWYQVEKGGLVEFNFAYFHPQIVRYRSARIPYTGFAFEAHFTRFDWALPQARLWDYLFVRREGTDLPPEVFARPPCPLRLVKEAGRWMLWERTRCPALASTH